MIPVNNLLTLCTINLAPMSTQYREAEATDADKIATLHAESWKRAYRGHLSDAYLDGPIEDERRSVWQARFATEQPSSM